MTPQGVILLLAIIVLMTEACTKTSLVGSPNNDLNIQSVDTVSMFTTTVKGDSVRTYTPVSSQQFPNYLVGRLDDPIFGNSTAIAYAQTRLLTAAPGFERTTLDSVVLSLPYATNGRHYGNINGPQTIIVSRLSEDMDAAEIYYSDKRFLTAEVLGQKTFVPNLIDSFDILIPESDTVVEERVPAQLRIPLSNSFGNELLANADNMNANDDFLEYFKGIEVKAGTNSDAILSLALQSSDITLFYSQEDSIFDANGDFDRVETIAKKYTFAINSFSAKSVYYKNNRDIVGTGRVDAPVKQYMNNGNNDLMFIQSMEGLMGKVTFPYIDALARKIVNKAELTVTIANDDNLTEFPVPDQLLVLTEVNGNFVIIEDVAVSINTAGGFELFGGDFVSEIINDVTHRTYTINISGHFQDMVDGLRDNSVYIVTQPKAQVASRAILGGSGHSEFPIKFKLSYTDIE
jgi:hypothetical protein